MIIKYYKGSAGIMRRGCNHRHPGAGRCAFRAAVGVMPPPNSDYIVLRCFGVVGHPDEGATRLLETVVRPEA